MSEQAPERPAGGGKKDNLFTRKIGPMPMWAWVAIISVALIGYAYLKNRQASNQQQQGATAGAGQVPQFVNQTFTNVMPPTAPAPVADIDHHPRPPDHGPAWDDESKKDKRVRNWEHKHPGQEYPFNRWQGNPTAAQLAAFNASPKWQPEMGQADQWPVDQGRRQGRWVPMTQPAAPQPVPGVDNTTIGQ